MPVSDVLCFGNLQCDVLCRTVTTLPPPGALHMIDAVDFALSGNGGNVAAALGRLGVPVDLAGYSGADIIGEQFRAELAALGAGTEKLLRHPTARTGTSIITLAPDGERSVLYVNGANMALEAVAAGTVVVTLGAEGCLLRAAEGACRVPAEAVEAVDCTGAGDGFVAGFIAGLMGGRAPLDCARLGCRVASFAVTGPGAYARIPPLATVEAMAAIAPA